MRITTRMNMATEVALWGRFILGLPVDTEIAASSDINFVRYNLTEADCLEYALNHRPEGIAATCAVKQAQAQTAASKSGYRPNVNADFVLFGASNIIQEVISS